MDGAAPISDDEARGLLSRLRAWPGAVLAISGGPDSLALMLLVAAQIGRDKAGWPPMVVGTVDHGLRPQAADEARAVAMLARERGLPVEILTIAERPPAGGVGTWARQQRYSLLAALALRHGLAHIVTAHHLDDQAETVLMRMAAGSGLTGLAGMERETRLFGCEIVRPLLGVAKARLVATCAARGVVPADDPGNRDERQARVRWRALLPALAGEGLTPGRLGLMATRLARADAALAAIASRLVAQAACEHESEAALALAALRDLPAELLLRVLRLMIGRVSPSGPDAVTPEGLRLQRLEALAQRLGAALAQGGAFHATIGGVALRRRGEWLVFRREKPRRIPFRQMF